MRLIFPIAQLQKAGQQSIYLDGQAELFDDLKKRDREIIAATPVTVKGRLGHEGSGWIAHFSIKTILTVPSTRSLEPVELPLELDIEEHYLLIDDEVTPFADESDEDDDSKKPIVIMIEDDQINLQKAIEDHLLLAIPTQIYTPAEQLADKMPAGKGWTVISETDYQVKAEKAAEEPNPEFAKLKGLFKNESDETLDND